MEKGLIFTYVLTYGGVIASIYQPYLGVLIYVCFAIIRPESMWYWAVPQGNYSRVVAIGLLVGWALHGFGNWNLGRARGIVIALLSFWAWMVLTALSAADQDVAWRYVEGQSKIFLPFVVGITVIDSLPKLKLLIWNIVLCQGYVALEMNLAYYGGVNRAHEYGFGGMDNNCIAIAMVAGVGMAFFLGLDAGRWWQKALAWVAAALMGHTVLFSFSRGGILGLILTGLVAFVLIPKQPKHYLVLALAILLGLRLAGPQVQERFGQSFGDTAGSMEASAQSRLDLWAACLQSMQKQPLGIGPDHWPLVAHEYGFTTGKHAHSLWLQLGAELGFPGLFCLLFFYGLCIARLWPYTRKTSAASPWYRSVACMVIASLIGFMFTAQFVTLYGLELPYYVTLVGAGALRLAGHPNTEAVAKPLNAPLSFRRQLRQPAHALTQSRSKLL
jgi:probable O-glycosylation ligase (exosortase A-associated)